MGEFRPIGPDHDGAHTQTQLFIHLGKGAHLQYEFSYPNKSQPLSN